MDTSEPSTSLELTPYERPSKCAICHRPAHGFHHGALTCRACCAFFRRSGGFKLNWKCKKDKNCDTDGKQFSCKKCRLEKCFKNGMTVENFQFDRDTTTRLDPKNTTTTVPTSLEKFLGRPHVIIRCEPKSSLTRKTFIDVSSLVEKGSDILSKSHVMPYSGIVKLAVHLRNMRSVNIHGKADYRKIGQDETRMFWELDFCQAAVWLSHFSEFQNLPITLKMKFLKSIWAVWSLLERVLLTVENSSKNTENSEYNVSLDKDTSVNVGKVEYELSWCTTYEINQLGYFFDLQAEFQPLKQIAEVLMTVGPTDIEQTFVLLHICFSYAGRVHQGEILKISEKLLESVSNQMHNYYINVLKMPNYAGRLARLMKCDRIVQEYIILRKQKMTISKTFDIFHLQFSHPEMFNISGF